MSLECQVCCVSLFISFSQMNSTIDLHAWTIIIIIKASNYVGEKKVVLIL